MCTFEEQQAETLLYLNKVGEVASIVDSDAVVHTTARVADTP